MTVMFYQFGDILREHHTLGFLINPIANFIVKINSPNRKKNYNVDEMRVVNTDRLWICRKINF
jgi:hypothetical protein